MMNATGDPQTILLLGGTSEIGLAIVSEYLSHAPASVVLAARDTAGAEAAGAQLLREGATSVRVVPFDASDPAGHERTLDDAWAAGDVDLAIVAFGVLGDNERLWRDADAAVTAFETNVSGAVSVGVRLGQRMTAQGHGQIIALSSVAGVKIRRSNFVYGSTKAGFDGFYTGLGEALAPEGVRVLVVRPGQVRTRMTAGLPDAPLTINPGDVARLAYEGVRKGRSLVWAPPAFEVVMRGLQHVPGPIFRRLNL